MGRRSVGTSVDQPHRGGVSSRAGARVVAAAFATQEGLRLQMTAELLNVQLKGFSLSASPSSASCKDDEPTAPPPTPSSVVTAGKAPSRLHTASRNANILDSLKEISLDAEIGQEGDDRGPGSKMPSAARTMIELKQLQKLRNEVNTLAPVPPRRGGGAAHGSPGTGVLDAVAEEHESDLAHILLAEKLQKRGRKAVLSHKARQRKDGNVEKGEMYQDRLVGRVFKHNRRKERMDRLKSMY